jgi:hypothetical protein
MRYSIYYGDQFVAEAETFEAAKTALLALRDDGYEHPEKLHATVRFRRIVGRRPVWDEKTVVFIHPDGGIGTMQGRGE